MPIRIDAAPLWTGPRSGRRPFPPPDVDAFHPTDCIHGRVAFDVDGESFPIGARSYPWGAGGYDDVCLADLIAVLRATEDDLAEVTIERFLEVERHPPRWRPFERRDRWVHVSDEARGVVVLTCDAAELRGAIPPFLVALRARIVELAPEAGESWWRHNCAGHLR